MFGIDEADLPAQAVSYPRAAVAAAVAAIKDNPFLPAEFIVSGLVQTAGSEVTGTTLLYVIDLLTEGAE